MPKITVQNKSLWEALERLNIGSMDTVARVVIDIDARTGITIHVQHYADSSVLKVIEALPANNVQIIREAKENG